MIRQILVPLDGSPQAEVALPYVAAIAKGLGSEVTILHAIGGSRVLTGRLTRDTEQRQYLEQLQADSQRMAQGYLEVQVKRLQDLGISVNSSITLGRPSEVIVGYGGDDKPDLIAMCTQGRSGLSGVALGSVAGHVLQNSRSPLLLVHPGEFAYKPVATVGKIVVPLDTSELAEAALPIAQELALGLKLTITLVLALPKLSRLYLGTEMVAHPSDILEKAQGEAAEYLKEVASRLEPEGTTVEWKVLHEDPGAAIVEYADQSKDSWITMATRGRSGLGRWVLGSVTDKVIRTGNSPMLIVRAAQS